jgi:hypothetical protein
MSTFYTGVDQQRYDAGEKFLPMNKFLKSYTPPKTSLEEGVTTSYGIPNTNAFINSSPRGGALQAGDINFDDFNRITTENYMRKQPTPFVDATYDQKIQDKFFGMPTWEQGVNPVDAGEYLAAGQDIPLELTRAGKMKEGWQNTKEGVAAMMGKIPSITGFLNKFGVQNFDSLSPLDQAFIKQSSGYRGPTIFGENTTGLNVDPFGRNVESLFGNYAEAVRDDFGNLSTALSPTGKIGSKYSGATFNDVTGQFEADDEDDPSSVAAAKKANQMNKMNLSKWGFDFKQINKQKQNEKIYQDRKADIARVQNKVNQEEAMINELASEKDVTNASGNVIASTVNPSVDPSYHGGTHNPHTETGWSGSKQGGNSYSRPGTEGAPPGQHHWADGGRVGLRYGGLLSIL